MILVILVDNPGFIEMNQLNTNKRKSGIGENSDVLFLTDQSQADNLGVSEKERFIFTIQTCSDKITLVNNVRDEIESQSEDSQFQCQNNDASTKKVLKENKGETEFKNQTISNQLVILKNPHNLESVSQTLLDLARKYEQNLPEGEQILISAYRIRPNNFREKAAYDKYSDEVNNLKLTYRVMLSLEAGKDIDPMKFPQTLPIEDPN